MTPAKKPKLAKNDNERQFQDKWLNEYSWLKYEATSKQMFCKLCIKVQKNNTFTTGCTMMKKDNLTKHQKTKDHREAIESSTLSTAMNKATVTATSKSEAAIKAAMTNVYFAAKNDLPSSLVPDLNSLCIHQGASQLQHLAVDKHTSYQHNTSISDFQECIAEVLQEGLKEKLKTFSKFSIMIDESTDISVKQNLVSYIRVLEADNFGTVTPQTYFLGISDLYRANAECIFTKVCDMLSDKGIEIKNLCSVSTDGAAVMVGTKSGVVTRLKQFVPGVLATHCIAHRLALSCATGADSIPYLVKYQDIMNSIFKFLRTPLRTWLLCQKYRQLLRLKRKGLKKYFTLAA